MPGSRARGLLAAPAIALLLAVSGCGGDDGGDEGIPQDTADSMLEMTSGIQQAADDQECDVAQERTTALRNEVDSLQEGETKRALDAMVTRLDENLDSDCETGTSPDAEAEEPETTTTEPVETAPATTTTTTTEPVEPPPEEETEEPATPEQPPGEGGGPNGPPQTPPGQQGGGAPPSGGVEERGGSTKKPGKPDKKPKKEKG